jgi:hypothetical protein
MRLFNAVGVLLCIVAATPAAEGQVGLTAGTEYGFGAYARVGTPQVAVELGAGLAPFLFIGSDSYDDYVKLWFPVAAGAKLSIAVSKPDDPDRFGVKFGVTYNGILKTGFGGGVDYRVGRSPDVILAGGLMVFPDAAQGIVDRFNEDEGTSYTKDNMTISLGEVQPFLSISIVF